MRNTRGSVRPDLISSMINIATKELGGEPFPRENLVHVIDRLARQGIYSHTVVGWSVTIYADHDTAPPEIKHYMHKQKSRCIVQVQTTDRTYSQLERSLLRSIHDAYDAAGISHYPFLA